MHEQHFPRKVTEAIERECSVIVLALVVRDDPPKKEHPWRDWRGGSVFGFFLDFHPVDSCVGCIYISVDYER